MAKLPDIDPLWKKLDSGAAAEILPTLEGLPKDAPLVYRTLHGLACYETGEFQKSEEILRQVLEVENENPVAQLFLVLALFEEGKDQEAGELLMKRAVLHPHRGFLIRFMRTFWPLRFEPSLGSFEQDLESEAKDPLASQYESWKSAAGDGEPVSLEPPEGESLGTEIQRHINELTSASGKRVRKGRSLATKYLKQGAGQYVAGDLASAQLSMVRAHEIRPMNEEVANHFAYVALFSGKVDEAMAALEPVLEEKVAKYDESREIGCLPTYDTLACYAWALHESGRHQDAIRVVSLVREEGPEDYGANFIAAVCWLMLNNEDLFKSAFNRAMDKFYIDTWEQLARPFVLKVGRWLEAGGRPKGQ